MLTCGVLTHFQGRHFTLQQSRMLVLYSYEGEKLQLTFSNPALTRTNTASYISYNFTLSNSNLPANPK